MGTKRAGGMAGGLVLPSSHCSKSPSFPPSVVPGPLPQLGFVILTRFPPGGPAQHFRGALWLVAHEADQDCAEPSIPTPPGGRSILGSPKLREEGCWDGRRHWHWEERVDQEYVIEEWRLPPLMRGSSST